MKPLWFWFLLYMYVDESTHHGAIKYRKDLQTKIQTPKVQRSLWDDDSVAKLFKGMDPYIYS